MDIERKMVSMRRVDDVSPIEGADSIEVATVGGWKCVVKKGEFKTGDVALYFEIDSLLPMIPVFEFLRPRGTKKMMVDGQEIEGYRLRTVKLRGQVSQGLLLPLSAFDVKEGDDLAKATGVIKFEAPIPAQLAGQVKGNFPSLIRKTDQERIQNLAKELEGLKGKQFEVTEKLDGSSMTVYFYKPTEGEAMFGVCSRNLDLKEVEGNTQWRLAREMALEEKLRKLDRSLAIQGECIGHGIQNNPYKLPGQEFRIFDIYDIEQGRYLTAKERYEVLKGLELMEHHVPITKMEFHDSGDVVGTTFDFSMEEVLGMADGLSMLGQDVKREGIVFKSLDLIDGQVFSFKAISNAFLLSEV